jgi:branched-chain amino acid transport system ATP-binding protein
VKDIMEAVIRLRSRVSLVIVEHHAESVLSIVDRAIVLVNGQVAYEGTAAALAADAGLQARLLGVVQAHAA